MELIRAYKFKIYPDAKRQEEIDERLVLAQQFYNKILEKSIASYQNGKTKVSMAQFNKFVKEIIQENKKYLKLYSQTRCEIEYRLLKSYQNFFRRIKEGNRKAGFPRFRSRDRYKSITYPQDNGSFSIRKGKLRVSRIGTMPIDLHRKIEGTIKTLAIKREGKDYYAVFTAEQIINPKEVKDINPVGIDMGINNFIALSDWQTIQKPKFFKQREKRIARWQRIVARRNKGSKRREKAKFHLQEEWKGITSQSNDFMHKLSDKLVNGRSTSFAVEALHIDNMLKNHSLAQSIQNASWRRFTDFLSYKAESAGMKVIKVDPRDTTQKCSRCHNIKRGSEMLTLKDKIYHCNVCGLVIGRDENASINICDKSLNSQSSNFDNSVVKSRAGLARSHAQGDMTSAMQQASKSQIEELRTYSANAGEAPTFR